MSVDALCGYLKEQFTHDRVTDAWAAQLKDANFEDEQVREELDPILHDTDNFTSIFDEVGKLADKIAVTDGDNTWKTLVESKIEIDRVNGLFWVFIDKALSKNSNTRDVEYGFAASCAWLKLAGLKGSTLFHFFNQYLYKMTLSVIRLIYRLKMYGSRTVTTKRKEKKGKGKKGAKISAPMMEDQEEEEENRLEFNDNELEDMLVKACDALYSLLKTTPLSTCPEQAKESVDLVRDLIRLDISKDTKTTSFESQRDMRSCDLISDRAFGLAHLLCESRHSTGGIIVHTRLVMPRLLFFSWEGEVVPGSQSIPSVMAVARDRAISFLKKRILRSIDQDELATIAKLVPNLMARCPERSEYRHRVAQSALDLLALLPKKTAHAQLQLVYTFGLTMKGGLRAITVEMIPTILQTMDLDQDAEEEDDREKSRREKKKGSDDEEEEGVGKKNKKKKGSDQEEEDDEMNGTKRKDKKKKEGNDDEDYEMNRTRRKKKKGSDEEDEESEEDGNATKRKKDKKKKKKRAEGDEEEDENEEEMGNTTRRRKRAAKDQSMLRMKKQNKRNEEESEEEEESEGEKEKKKKKKLAEQSKLKKAQRIAPVQLRPSLLMLIVRGCLDKTGNLRARSLQQLAQMITDGMGEDLKEAADALVRDHPRILVQAMKSVDEEKEEAEEEEDEEKKARAAKLAELAAAELQIKNGLVYIVKTRMEDDVGAVRKAAIGTLQSLFYEWEMDDDEAEEVANALKLRCLDNLTSVRKQAMDTLSFLLEQSLEKGHRPLLETTWLKAVLPLINDRENAVQAMAARLVEEHLINPIMRASTPDACWKMLKRVEEEVSNRRLLVRTLAFLSTQEVKTMKKTVVDTLNKKLETDSDHSNVIWMLLADLSTVFGDKIDPRTAVRTWYDLPDNETANTMSYVAKVVGEGSMKLRDDERDKVAQDIEDKLFGYRVHGPHIATVYLALARLMDAVGELASGKDELERFGRRLLEEASRIIYKDLEMFTEKEEDKQEVAKEDEIKVIRIVITIGEIIQLSPALIDFANKLFDGLQLIMSSELFLSEAFQLRRQMNSAVPSETNSRVPSAMGHHEPMSSQGSGQTMMVHSETGKGGSQQTVIPSQVQQHVKTMSLRKALFTATVRRCALTTIGKFCLMDEAIAKACIATFIRQLKFNPDHIIRNNIVIVLCDLCIRYTLLVDKYTPIIASCLKDRSILVRQQTLECLTILIKEAFIRWEGQLMYRFVATILDECRPIREYAMFCLKDVLLPQNPSMFFNHFIECLLYFNNVPRKYKMASTDSTNDLDNAIKFSLSGTENEAARIKLYEFMLDTFDDKQKFITMAKMCEEIFTAVYSEEMLIADERVVALLTDAFKVISCEQMQLRLDVGKKGDEEDEEQPAPQAVQDAAKSMITAVFRTAIITSIMPHVLELRRFLIEKRHPIMKYMMGVLRALTRSHMDQLQEFFAGDRIALREIEYDIKRLNNLEEKLKLRAAQAAQKEAERALLPPSRRQSRVQREEQEKIEKEEKKRDETVKREVPSHPNQVEMMEGIEEMGRMEDEETVHHEARDETSINKEKENGESVDVEMEMDEPAIVLTEKENEEMAMDEEKEEGEEEEGQEGEKEKEGRNEDDGEGEEMEVEERQEGENGENGEEDEGRKEKENGQAEGVAIVEEEEKIDEVEKEKKTRAEMGEAEIKEEPIEVEEEEEKDIENRKEERRKKRNEEKDKRLKAKVIEEMDIKEEPLDEGEERENQFVVPMMIGGKKRLRAASELSCMNESVINRGYGQSTPKKGTPIGDEDGEEAEDGPRMDDLDISAIAPRPDPIIKPQKSRPSRKPKTGTIEE